MATAVRRAAFPGTPYPPNTVEVDALFNDLDAKLIANPADAITPEALHCRKPREETPEAGCCHNVTNPCTSWLDVAKVRCTPPSLPTSARPCSPPRGSMWRSASRTT